MTAARRFAGVSPRNSTDDWALFEGLLAQACDALSYLNDRGYRHGDLKPAQRVAEDRAVADGRGALARKEPQVDGVLRAAVPEQERGRVAEHPGLALDVAELLAKA